MKVGVLAEFRSADALLAAAGTLREQGYRMVDAYTPYPIKGLEESLGLQRSYAAKLIFPIGLAGAAFGFGVQVLLNVVLYPLNVGGRPPLSFFPYLIITFETMVLFSAVGAFILLLWLCRLPRLNHPLFDVDGFDSASVDGFWLGINAADPCFDPDKTEPTLQTLGAARVEFVGGSA